MFKVQIVIGIIIFALSSLIFFVYKFNLIKRKTLLEVQNRFGDSIKLIDSGANFFGQESSGLKQIRGNGMLVLTDQELVFLMYMPRKEVVIPLSKIKEISNPKSFLGKTKFQPLLKVDFTQNDSINQDSMAWLTSKREEFETALKT